MQLTNLAAAKPAAKNINTQQLHKAPAGKKATGSNKNMDLTNLWGAAPYGGFGYGGFEAGYPGYGAWGFEGYGPANYADASISARDGWAAAGAAATSQWDGVVAGQDAWNAKRFQAAA